MPPHASSFPLLRPWQPEPPPRPRLHHLPMHHHHHHLVIHRVSRWHPIWQVGRDDRACRRYSSEDESKPCTSSNVSVFWLLRCRRAAKWMYEMPTWLLVIMLQLMSLLTLRRYDMLYVMDRLIFHIIYKNQGKVERKCKVSVSCAENLKKVRFVDTRWNLP